MLHPTSLAIGAGVAALVIAVSFFALTSSNQGEIVLEESLSLSDTQPAAPTQVTHETFFANGSPVLGDHNAPITLVEFGDYQCHFCNVFFHSTEGAILEEYVDTGKVKMIFKDYNIIGPDSINASHGAHCASDQGLFWEYHDVLYSNWTGENNGWASVENLARYAQETDLDMNAWSECMDKRPHSQRILASNNDAKTLELTGTPAFFVIGPDASQPITRLFGAQPLETFERVFDERLGE